MGEKLEKYSVIVKFEHLNPKLQELIGTAEANEIINEWLTINFKTIRAQRRFRAFAEGITLLNLMNAVLFYKLKPIPVSREGLGLSSFFATLTAGSRTLAAKTIQKKHKELAKRMKEVGLLKTKFEGNYPKDWINPAIIAKTHPVFYVKRNGDLIFPKMTRTEYARYVFQKRFPGKLGLNPWRWRAVLKKPEAPEKVADLVNRKIDAWLAATRKKGAFAIKPARAKNRRMPKRRPI